MIQIISFQSGNKKTGGRWHKITLRRKKSNGQSVLQEFWLSDEVAQKMRENGIGEDTAVKVHCELDENLRPVIVSIEADNDTDDASFFRG